ncbi:hypothetical protein PM082_000271 [Marasmius tenuissimus]|nr:hypothetical protein PM082_000271 [Marasmius tenuissimus]
MESKLEDLSYEVQQELRDLQEALKDSTKLKSLPTLKEDDAQRRLDLLQYLVGLPQAKPARSLISSELPSCHSFHWQILPFRSS